MLSIAPEFLTYLDRLENGERVIWEPHMNFLYCFSARFCGDHNRVVCGSYNGMFEPLYEYDDTGHWDPVDPIGIKFYCVKEQFFEHDVLHHLEPNGSLNAIRLLLDAIRFLKKSRIDAEERQEAAMLLQFLRREPIQIPYEEISAILATTQRH